MESSLVETAKTTVAGFFGGVLGIVISIVVSNVSNIYAWIVFVVLLVLGFTYTYVIFKMLNKLQKKPSLKRN